MKSDVVSLTCYLYGEHWRITRLKRGDLAPQAQIDRFKGTFAELLEFLGVDDATVTEGGDDASRD